MPRLSLFIKLWTLEYRIGKIRQGPMPDVSTSDPISAPFPLWEETRKEDLGVWSETRETREESEKRKQSLSTRSLEALLFFFFASRVLHKQLARPFA